MTSLGEFFLASRHYELWGVIMLVVVRVLVVVSAVAGVEYLAI